MALMLIYSVLHVLAESVEYRELKLFVCVHGMGAADLDEVVCLCQAEWRRMCSRCWLIRERHTRMNGVRHDGDLVYIVLAGPFTDRAWLVLESLLFGLQPRCRSKS